MQNLPGPRHRPHQDPLARSRQGREHRGPRSWVVREGDRWRGEFENSFVSGLFYADKLVEWGVYGVVATLMLTTGFAASLIPAVSVTRVDPVEALKQE